MVGSDGGAPGLALDAYRHLAFLEHTGFIDYQNPVGIAQVFDDIFRHRAPDRHPSERY